MTHINLGHFWKCNSCGKEGRTYHEWLPDGWLSRIEPVESDEHYCSEECLFETMTPEEIKDYKNSVWMA